MLKGNLLYLLYVAAAGAVGVGGFYVVPKLINPTGPEMPAIVESQPADTGKSDRPIAQKPEAAPATEMAKADSDAAAPDMAAKPIVPGFDLLRVEPDGSTVIAGFGTPNTEVEIINGETVIATAKIGPTGDFVAVLDEPLPAGDYQLRLRTKSADGSTVISEDVATVSVPEDPSGQLLAMVGKPGEASRILTQPEAKEVAEKPAEVASLSAEAAAPSTKSDTPAEAADAATKAETDEKIKDTAPDVGSEAVLPSLPAGAADIFAKAPEIAVGGVPAAEIAAVDAEAVEPKMDASEPVVKPVGEPATDQTIRVDAVEIEGDKIFVAGAATPGFKVRVLADGGEIGSTVVDKDGRFIVESTHNLSVGNHEIAAELISPQAGEVVLRAVVPFVRPEGANMSAVASAEPAPAEPAPGAPVVAMSTDVQSSPGSLALPELASLNGLRDDVLTGLSKFKTMLEPGGTVSAEDLTKFSGDLALRLEKVVAEPLPENASEDVMKSAMAMKETAQKLLRSLKEAGAVSGDALPDLEQMKQMRETIGDALAVLSAPEAGAVVAAKKPAAEMTAAAESVEGSSPPRTDGARTVEQAPLEPAAGSVIIRRGDTLWQISRRTYGQGVRYTTIYLANQQQITNPDRISPGQVFQVPDTPEPVADAERIHNELLEGHKPAPN